MSTHSYLLFTYSRRVCWIYFPGLPYSSGFKIQRSYDWISGQWLKDVFFRVTLKDYWGMTEILQLHWRIVTGRGSLTISLSHSDYKERHTRVLRIEKYSVCFFGFISLRGFVNFHMTWLRSTVPIYSCFWRHQSFTKVIF